VGGGEGGGGETQGEALRTSLQVQQSQQQQATRAVHTRQYTSHDTKCGTTRAKEMGPAPLRNLLPCPHVAD
jgi:hypothetical protein